MKKFKKEISLIIIMFFVLIIFSSPLWANDENNLLNESHEEKINTLSINETQTGSFNSLNELINDKNIVELDRNYQYNPDKDFNLKNGISISKNLIIDGKGFTINSTNASKLFNINQKASLTLKNIILLNDNPQTASAITNLGKLNFDNVTFTTQKQIVAGNLNAAIVNEGDFNINNTIFKNSFINCTSNGVLYVYGLLIKNSGNLAIENTKISNNGILARANSVQISGGLIYNSGSLTLNNVNMTDSYIKVKASVSSIFGFILGSSDKSIININNSNFENNHIHNNASSNSAMANVLRAANGELFVYNSKFYNNTGSLNGGAIGYYSKNLMIIENNIFDSNSVSIQGGAIFTQGNLKSNNNTFRNNFAGRNGGAIYVYGYYDTKNTTLGNVNSTNDVFEYNWVESSPDAYGQASILSWGGAICSKAGNLKLINDTFYKNKASMGDGGAIANYLSSFLKVSHCIFKENEATRWDVWTHASGLGGAILIPQTEMVDEDNLATFDIEYSIFDNNIAVAGLALYSVPYQNIPCDFNSNNNYWGSNNPFFKELIGKYQLSDVVFPDNYIIMEIEGNDTVQIATENTYKILLNKINEKGIIKQLDEILPEWKVNIDTNLNPLSNNTVLIKNNQGVFQYLPMNTGPDTFTVNNKFYKKNIEVIKQDLKLDLKYNNTANGVLLNISLQNDVNDEIHIKLYDETYNIQVKNGSALLKLPKLPIGITKINISYNGSDKYNIFSKNYDIIIEKNILDINNITCEVSDSNTLTINLTKDATGKILFDVNGNNYYAEIHNGSASLDISALGTGVKIISWKYLGDEFYDEISGNFTINISGNVKIISNNINAYYTDNTLFKVQILTGDGKSIGKNKEVLFKINGKIIKSFTDEKGFASFIINQIPNKYLITTQFGDVKVENTIIVKNVLKAKNLITKKSKKIKFKASLKGKKPLTGKKVLFKIKGKTYSAKTNKKGIAKVNLKKLKVGKYKIIITYAQSRITKTIKITK